MKNSPLLYLRSVLTSDSVKDLNRKEGDQILLLVTTVRVVPVKE